MGRWLVAAREVEKKSETLEGGTDKTHETPHREVLSVLSVASTGVSENFSPKPVAVGPTVHRCQCGAVGIIAEGWFVKTPEKARWYCGPCYRGRA